MRLHRKSFVLLGLTAVFAGCGGGGSGGSGGPTGTPVEAGPLNLNDPTTSEAVAAYAIEFGAFSSDISNLVGSGMTGAALARAAVSRVRAVQPRADSDICNGGGTDSGSSSGNTETVTFDNCNDNGDTINGQLSVTVTGSDTGTVIFGASATPLTVTDSSSGLIVNLLNDLAFTDAAPEFDLQFQGTLAILYNSSESKSISVTLGGNAADPLAVDLTQQAGGSVQLGINGPFRVSAGGFGSSCPGGSAVFTTTTPIIFSGGGTTAGELSVTGGNNTSETITFNSDGSVTVTANGTSTTYTASQLQGLCDPVASS
jgi:hypothetical protein